MKKINGLTIKLSVSLQSGMEKKSRKHNNSVSKNSPSILHRGTQKSEYEKISEKF